MFAPKTAWRRMMLGVCLVAGCDREPPVQAGVPADAGQLDADELGADAFDATNVNADGVNANGVDAASGDAPDAAQDDATLDAGTAHSVWPQSIGEKSIRAWLAATCPKFPAQYGPMVTEAGCRQMVPFSSVEDARSQGWMTVPDDLYGTFDDADGDNIKLYVFVSGSEVRCDQETILDRPMGHWRWAYRGSSESAVVNAYGDKYCQFNALAAPMENIPETAYADVRKACIEGVDWDLEGSFRNVNCPDEPPPFRTPAEALESGCSRTETPSADDPDGEGILVRAIVLEARVDCNVREVLECPDGSTWNFELTTSAVQDADQFDVQSSFVSERKVSVGHDYCTYTLTDVPII